MTKRGEIRNFLENVVMTHVSDDCLIWPFARGDHGYALMWNWVSKKVDSVSRIVCTHIHGPPRPGDDCAHSCGKGHEGCVAPAHLRWDTRAGNAADMQLHGTRLYGSRHGRAKLDEHDVAIIRSLRGVIAHEVLARRFGVGKPAISRIQNGKRWPIMTSYLQNTRTGRKFEIIALDRNKNVLTLRGETGGVFQEPYDKAKLKELGYAYVQGPVNETADT